jgi:hypothetical protein
VNGTESSDVGGTVSDVATRPSGAAAVRTHLTLLVGLTLCGLAFWFELGRALRGNNLSWAYVFEWPLLAIFAVYMWWKLLHPGFTIRRRRHEKPVLAPEYEGMLAAWQGEQRRLEERRRSEESESSSSMNGESETSRANE